MLQPKHPQPQPLQLLTKKNLTDGFKTLIEHEQSTGDYQIELEKDYEVKIIKTTNEKLRILKTLEKTLDLTHLKFESTQIYPDHIPLATKFFTTNNIYINKTFKLNLNFTTVYEISKSLTNMYKSIYGNKIITRKRIRKESKLCYEYTTDQEWITEQLNLWRKTALKPKLIPPNSEVKKS